MQAADDRRPELATVVKLLSTLFVVAAHTGLLSALYRKLKLKDALIAGLVSGTAGVIVGALCLYAWGMDRWYLTFALCGIAGWAGGNVVLDRLTVVAWTLLRGYQPPSAVDVLAASVPVPHLDIPAWQTIKPPPAKTAEWVDVGLPPLPTR